MSQASPTSGHPEPLALRGLGKVASEGSAEARVVNIPRYGDERWPWPLVRKNGKYKMDPQRRQEKKSPRPSDPNGAWVLHELTTETAKSNGKEMTGEEGTWC